ncbi:chorismate mutase [Alkalispirillum mobile]|uniref:Bifunctional chorismate mutase/prephenate dehydratase n=1 Tax=Alkalispirillum mobile TaxID=85925 RepID=A0A498C277_9GAMM|nr:prephenate dehydratase [Alkalispirillum mobile]RLK48696.1 chorismate mutase [Alkalispirillum mobile]
MSEEQAPLDDQAALQQVRARIDALDDEILRLVSERARMAEEVARVKREAGHTSDFYRPEREAQVLRRVRQTNPGPLGNEAVTRLFREIMSACLAIQLPLRVAFLGPEGTYTQEAALKHFGHSMGTAPLSTIAEVFREVESGAAHYGVVPVENSTEGVVTHTVDRFLNSPLQVVGEVQLPIHHALASRETEWSGIQRIYSHQQGLAQCRAWVDTHLPGVEQVPVTSTAEAARMAAAEGGAAAIASEAACELYELPVLATHIEDEPGNTTRFLVVGPESPPPSGDDKTSLVISRANQPGGLYRLLEPLARHGLNMTRIESRPAPQGVWEYVFFVDLLGHAEDEAVRAALAEIQEQASLCRVLGSYPRAL